MAKSLYLVCVHICSSGLSSGAYAGSHSIRSRRGKASLEASGCRAMDRPAIHDLDDPVRQMLEQLGHKGFNLRGPEIVCVPGKVQTQAPPLGRDGNGRDGREAVPSIPTVLDRCTALGRILLTASYPTLFLGTLTKPKGAALPRPILH